MRGQLVVFRLFFFAFIVCVAAARPVASYATDWSGPYIGAHVGGAFDSSELSIDERFVAEPSDDGETLVDINGNAVDVVDDAVSPLYAPAFQKHDDRSILGGLEAGYNVGLGNGLIVGIAGNWSWTGLGQAEHVPRLVNIAGADPTGMTFGVASEIDWLASLRGRLGYAYRNFLIYGTGGIAWGKASFRGDNFIQESIVTPDGMPRTSFTELGLHDGPAASSEVLQGWAAGGGVEYKIGQFVVGLEYLHYDLGDHSAFNGDDESEFHYKHSVSVNTVQASIKYGF